MKLFISKKVIAAVFITFSFASVTSAAIVQNDLSGLSPLTVSSGTLSGISVSPFETSNGGLQAYYNSNIFSFVIRENGLDYIGVGPYSFVGADLTNFTIVHGSKSQFSLSNPTGDYFFPVYKESLGSRLFGAAYISASYDNVTQTLTFVSSTAQDVVGEPLFVSAIPEVSSSFLGLVGVGVLMLRRRR